MHSHNSKIVIDLISNVATRVQFIRDGVIYEIQARKEVVLSAGAINSPQTLMLSGVGPREKLQKFDILMLADLPVGRNLEDHIGTSIFFRSDVSPEPMPFLSNEAILEFVEQGTGPLTLNGEFEIISLLDLSKSADARPEIEQLFARYYEYVYYMKNQDGQFSTEPFPKSNEGT